jgi:CubicO group peptidase (beta-lactamase class C family)
VPQPNAPQQITMWDRRFRLSTTRARQAPIAQTLLLLLLPLIANAQLDPAAIERSAQAELTSAGIPGTAIGIVQNRQLTYAKAFGLSNIDTSTPVTPEMLFRLGSTTKMLTAAAVLSLPIDLEAPIGKYIPALDPAIAKLTANQLLSHTAGIKDEAIMNGRHDDAALGEELLRWKSDWLFTQPGKIHSYSNPGYWLAGYLAEVVSGKPYADMMSDRIFKPNNMERTTVRPTMAMTWPLSQGHDLIDGKISVLRPAPDNAANWPAGSIFSNLSDLSKWTIALMNGAYPQLSQPHTDIPGTHTKYGYGLIVDGGTWQHAGSRAGFGSSITMVPASQTALIVLCNRTGANLPKTRALIMQMLNLQKPTEAESHLEMQLDPAPYQGDWRNGAAVIHITPEDKITRRANGMIVIRTGGATRTLFPVGKPDYLVQGERAYSPAPPGPKKRSPP